MPANNTVMCNGRMYRLVPETEYAPADAPPAAAPPAETSVRRPETRAGTSKRLLERSEDDISKRARGLADLFDIDEHLCRDVVQKLSNEKFEEFLRTAL